MANKRLAAEAATLGSLLAALILTAQTATAQTATTPEQMKIILAAAAEGAKTWAAVCESCHGPPNPNTPARTQLLAMSADHIYASLVSGKMKVMGDTITDSQKRAVSMYLTGKPLSETPAATGDAALPTDTVLQPTDARPADAAPNQTEPSTAE